MTDPDRRVATLAAVFVPTRAAALLGRLGTPGASEALTHGVRLTGAPRRERLQALSAALTHEGPAVRARADAIAALERKRIANVVRTLAEARAHHGVSPVVLRLCREHLAR